MSLARFLFGRLESPLDWAARDHVAELLGEREERPVEHSPKATGERLWRALLTRNLRDFERTLPPSLATGVFTNSSHLERLYCAQVRALAEVLCPSMNSLDLLKEQAQNGARLPETSLQLRRMMDVLGIQPLPVVVPWEQPIPSHSDGLGLLVDPVELMRALAVDSYSTLCNKVLTALKIDVSSVELEKLQLKPAFQEQWERHKPKSQGGALGLAFYEVPVSFGGYYAGWPTHEAYAHSFLAGGMPLDLVMAGMLLLGWQERLQIKSRLTDIVCTGTRLQSEGNAEDHYGFRIEENGAISLCFSSDRCSSNEGMAAAWLNGEVPAVLQPRHVKGG